LEASLGDTPELAAIKNLFDLAQYGISFGKETMDLIGKRILQIHLLRDFELFIEILNLFQELSQAPDQNLLHPEPVRNPYGFKDKKRLDKIYRFIEANYQNKIQLHDVASLSNLTKEAFCRYFKKMTKLTFTQFVNHYRIDVAKKLLVQGNHITDTCFECGFDSVSYFNRTFKRVTGKSPMTYKKEYLSNL